MLLLEDRSSLNVLKQRSEEWEEVRSSYIGRRRGAGVSRVKSSFYRGAYSASL
jgi:hypothetical protein